MIDWPRMKLGKYSLNLPIQVTLELHDVCPRLSQETRAG